MRVVKFRGISIRERKWIYGCFIHESMTFSILEDFDFLDSINKKIHPVYKHTIGQFTGFLDKNGIEIYENDKVKNEFGEIGVVKYGECTYYADHYRVTWDGFFIHNIKSEFNKYICSQLEVVGNAFDDFADYFEKLSIGDTIMCMGDGLFFGMEEVNTIKDIRHEIDEVTGEKYKVIVLSFGREFDCRNGFSITNPISHYLYPIA